MSRPAAARCYVSGSGEGEHRGGCRPGRPLCRWRRGEPCRCDAYPFPHRPGSEPEAEARWDALFQPMRGGRAL